LNVSFVLITEMARIRSTARLTNEGEETEATETAPISEVMRRSRLVVQEEGEASLEKDTCCWGPLSSEGPQKHDLTMFLECNM
jgi:hypothetical protein